MDFNESSWLTVCESVCFPKETEDEDGTGLWADWLTDWLGLVAAEDNAIGSFSVDDLWDRPNDEEVEGNGSDFLGLGLLICVQSALD